MSQSEHRIQKTLPIHALHSEKWFDKGNKWTTENKKPFWS